MSYFEGLGKFLEQLRGKMSLREAAQKSGLSHAYIRDLELERNRSTNDKIKPSPNTLKKLSEAYNCSYTKLMEIAGYLHKDEETQPVHTEMDMGEVLYIEVGAQEITYQTQGGQFIRNINSLTDFTDFLEKLDELGFKKLDADLFVNLHLIKKYVDREGKLYFDKLGKGKSVTISALRQKKYHDLILRAVADNNGTALEYNFARARLESIIQPDKRET